MSSCVRLSVVCLSVCLPVTFVHPTQAIEIFGNIFISYERSFILVFCEEEWLVGGDSLYVQILGQPTPVAAKSPIFNRYSPVAP